MGINSKFINIFSKVQKKMDMNNDGYNDRVSRLFERVGNLQNGVDEEKSNRIKEIETILMDLEKRLEEMKDNKNEKIDYFDKMIKQLQLTLEEESENRQRLENDLNTEITGLEKNCQKIIEEAGKERQVLDTKLINKMNGHVEQIQAEIQRSLSSSSETNPDLEYIVQEEIPKLRRELTNEINLRRELEGKI